MNVKWKFVKEMEIAKEVKIIKDVVLPGVTLSWDTIEMVWAERKSQKKILYTGTTPLWELLEKI